MLRVNYMGILFQYFQIDSTLEDLGTQARSTLDGQCLVQSRKKEDKAHELEEIRAFHVLGFMLLVQDSRHFLLYTGHLCNFP